MWRWLRRACECRFWSGVAKPLNRTFDNGLMDARWLSIGQAAGTGVRAGSDAMSEKSWACWRDSCVAISSGSLHRPILSTRSFLLSDQSGVWRCTYHAKINSSMACSLARRASGECVGGKSLPSGNWNGYCGESVDQHQRLPDGGGPENGIGGGDINCASLTR